MTRNYSNVPKFNSAGQAKLNEQKRIAELETAERNKELKPFTFQCVAVRPQYRVTRPNEIHLEGGLLCPRTDPRENRCLTKLTIKEDKVSIACQTCGYTNTLPKPYEEFFNIALEAVKGQLRWIQSGKEILSLDTPFDAIKASSESKNRKIEVVWSQKDGRDQSIVYFIDKSKKQGKKVHVFVDMDREELRHDASDVSPHHIVAKLEATFPNSEIRVEYKNQDD